LPYAFEKSDAQEKWGGENFFSAMMGGRSLRFTAVAALGVEFQGGGNSAEEKAAEGALRKLYSAINGRWVELLAGAATRERRAGGQSGGDVFDDVGGAAVWRALEAAVRANRPNADGSGGM
jgi:hypothetical protein